MIPQGTHIPVLISIGRLFPEIKRVMEYGSGECSTLTFLNRDIFPNLESLVSTENQAEWAEDTRRRVGDDPRWTLILDDETDPINDVDLIFVDSLTGESRVRTLNKILAMGFQGIIVCHDSQEPYYNAALPKFPYRYNFPQFWPNTAIVSTVHIPKLEEVRI
jgi:hypothetical protein